jgi:Na+-transporting methylmalonyl-CoA/oxaloacetate decarboxylase gamma subunit
MASGTTIWGEAGLVAGIGFGTVFLVLIILAVITWLIGLIFQRIKRGQEKAKAAAETEAPKTQS